MAREQAAGLSPGTERDLGTASLDQVVTVLLAALSAVLVFSGLNRPGAGWAVAAGCLCGAAALVLVARRSMALFTLVVLVVRPAVDGLRVGHGSGLTDPALVLDGLFVVVGLTWWVARWLQGRRHPGSVAGLAMAGFLAAACLATLGSEAPGRSVVGLARLATAVLMFFIVDRLCESTGRPDHFLLAVLAAAVVPVAAALLGPLVGVHRVEVKDQIERVISTFTQSNPLGHFLTIVILVLAAYVLARPGRPRVLAIAALVPVSLTLALTYTRLAWGAAVIGLLVMMWVAGRRWLVPALLVALLAAAALSPDVGHRIDQLTSPNAAVSGSESGVSWRLGQWADVVHLADANPVTGIGPDVVVLRLSNRQPPHNDYLRALVELGVVGLIAYVALLGSLVGLAVGAQRRASGPLARTVALASVGVITAFVLASMAANILGQVVLLWYVFAIAGAAAWVGRHGVVRTAPDHPAARLAGPSRPGERVSEPVRVSGGAGDIAARPRRWWPIGLVVVVVTAIVGLVVTWETPRVFVSRATVFPPVGVTNALAGQRYINDMQAAINSFVVRSDVAEKLGVPRSAFGDRVEVHRVRQSSVMEVVMQSAERLPDPAQALEQLITRAGQSLAAPDVEAAAAQQAQVADAVAKAEDGAVTATRARDTFLAERNGVTPASELAILGPELAQLRLCASGAIVPTGANQATCGEQLDQLQAKAVALARDDDALAALDRDLAQAESEVAEAERDQRDADAAAIKAASGPAVEVSQAGDEVSQLPNLARRSLAIVGGALLLGFAVVVALALLTHPDRRSRPEAPAETPDRPRRPTP